MVVRTLTSAFLLKLFVLFVLNISDTRIVADYLKQFLFMVKVFLAPFILPPGCMLILFKIRRFLSEKNIIKLDQLRLQNTKPDLLNFYKQSHCEDDSELLTVCLNEKESLWRKFCIRWTHDSNNTTVVFTSM